MPIGNLYNESEQARIQAEIESVQENYQRKNVPRRKWRYFARLAEEYELVQRLENEVERYQKGELNSLTSDVEIAEFFGVRNFSVQRFLNRWMDSGKRNIKADACLETGRRNGWEHLKNSGKIPPLEGRVRNEAIKAIKKKWGKMK